jgi:hypothetical protein
MDKHWNINRFKYAGICEEDKKQTVTKDYSSKQGNAPGNIKMKNPTDEEND